ncbi:hypothetical protein FB45DRAFT_785028 [Roridomyces roridus]|uniref:F-box domain-containing protein n=1 Tax=Roridomyces roridus TaxID=1738132 RepID=A0AAD7FVS9_9AGAR|nr:hypothetical protein FB45DRAFT_807416 [Roridomyces roridus]KAJ7640967.1 hypothetical protein FB45DRAFT_785028 [Roridomyces roridus]
MTSTILLRPRPYAQQSGSFALVALLPPPKPVPALPSEIWTGIFEFLSAGSEALWFLLRVCKLFKDLALPLVYARVQLSKISSLHKFTARLLSAEDGWDSIRRVPWSAPGRWVQTLDLSAIACVDALILDSLLVTVFPLIPFLGKLSMNSSNRFTLSGRAMDALGQRQGAANLRVLEGISYVPSGLAAEEPLTKLLRCLPNLEELEVIGRGLDPTEMDFSAISLPDSFLPLQLPCLRTLTIISVYSSSLFLSLLLSPLPALQKLTITPSHDVPPSLSSQFIATHGTSLRSLLLFTPKSWPTRLLPSPHSILCTSPTLRHLSLEKPLPAQLDLPAGNANTHPLQILSIPRPDAEFWSVLDRLLPRLPLLCMVRARDVRWLRKGMGLRAQEAGVQGEMREWKRRLARRRIRMVDAEWNECE